jgi:nucleoside-diphosphate-sugar epimerase
VGTALGLRLLERGAAVWGIRRSIDRLPNGIQGIRADLSVPESLVAIPDRLDAVFYLASSDSRSDAGYRKAYLDGMANLLSCLRDQGQAPRRILMSSSTSLYGVEDGSWVDEDTPARPGPDFRRHLLEGEQQLLGSGFPATVVRFSGIYGPTRIRLLRRVQRGEEACAEGPPIYTNRIHAEDCAAILEHILFLDRADPLYVASDNDPVARCELLNWLADQLGAPKPPQVAKVIRTRGNKRCRNDRLKATGYRFRFPTYREGYRQIIEAMRPK